jgi:hypothetical protein
VSQLQFREIEKRYQDAVVKVREKLLQLPPDIVDLAYRFRDLCEEVGEQLTRRVEIDKSTTVYAKYTILVTSEWESGYQDQTWQNKYLSVGVVSDYLPKDFRSPQVLK